MDTQKQDTNETPTVDPTRLRYLSPDTCLIHVGTHGALHVTIKDERIYGGVYAAYAFPVAHPNEYISLLHRVGERGKDMEIGIIRNLDDFPPDARELVRQALARRYFIHTITSFRHIGWKYGFIAMDAETDKGPVSILVRWSHDRAVDYGRQGKVLIDVDENRYLVPDVSKLSPAEQREFLRYIYW